MTAPNISIGDFEVDTYFIRCGYFVSTKRIQPGQQEVKSGYFRPSSESVSTNSADSSIMVRSAPTEVSKIASTPNFLKDAINFPIVFSPGS